MRVWQNTARSVRKWIGQPRERRSVKWRSLLFRLIEATVPFIQPGLGRFGGSPITDDPPIYHVLLVRIFVKGVVPIDRVVRMHRLVRIVQVVHSHIILSPTAVVQYNDLFLTAFHLFSIARLQFYPFEHIIGHEETDSLRQSGKGILDWVC